MPGTSRSFVKRRPGAPAGFFGVEAAGIAWLAAAEPDGGPRVVRVIEAHEDGLVLEHVEREQPDPARTGGHRREFGRALAHLHARGAPWFGCPPPPWTGDGFIGDLPMPHVHDPDDPAARHWGTFYARYRLEPFLRRAERTGAVDAACARAVRAVEARLEAGDTALTGPEEPPARLHGDLWSGNVLWTAQGAVLIDPAAHGGHRETDLAMLALFGQSGLDEILAGYQEVAPPAPGWRDRVPLHQLHPLLVHAALFGGGYGTEVARAAARLT